MKLFGNSVALRSMVIPLLIIQGGKGLNPQSLKPYVFPVSLNRRKTVLCAINGKRPNVQGCQKPDVTEVDWVWLFCTKPHFHTFLIINLFNDCCSRSKTEEIASGVFVIGTQEKISSTLRTMSQAECNALQKRSFQLGKDMVFQAMPDEWNSIPQQELQTSDSEKQLHG